MSAKKLRRRADESDVLCVGTLQAGLDNVGVLGTGVVPMYRVNKSIVEACPVHARYGGSETVCTPVPYAVPPPPPPPDKDTVIGSYCTPKDCDASDGFKRLEPSHCQRDAIRNGTSIRYRDMDACQNAVKAGQCLTCTLLTEAVEMSKDFEKWVS